MENGTLKRPSFGLALMTFVGVAAIISYGLLGLGLDAHVPIALAATFAGLVGKIAVGISWKDMFRSIADTITSSAETLLILITIGMLVGLGCRPVWCRA